MRKLLIVGIVLLLAAPVFAGDATSKGTWTVGQAFGGSTGIGYFYMDNIEVGASVNFSSMSSDASGTDVSTTNMGFSVGGAYYLSQMGPGTPYASINLGWNSSSDDSAGDPKSSSLGFGVGVGYLWFLTDHVSWFGGLGFSSTSSSFEAGGASSDSGTSGISFMVGLKAFIF